MADILTAVLIKVTASAIVCAAKTAYAKIADAPVFAQAIASTEKAFPGLEVKHGLTKWCQSEKFNALLTAAQQGNRSLTDEQVIASFLEVGEFYDGDHTSDRAQAVLKHFFNSLVEEIYRSKDAINAVAKRQEILHEETKEAVEQTAQAVVQTLEQRCDKLEQLITGKHAFADKTSEPDIRERIFNDRVDQARKLLDNGKPKTAKQMLEDLRLELRGHTPSKALVFRIATNLGFCALQLDDPETAIREIESAFQEQSENQKAITNLSLIRLLQGNPVEALSLAEKARTISPQDAFATANYIQALFALRREAEIPPLLEKEPWIERDDNCCFVLGHLYLGRHRFSEAERFLRLALEQDAGEPRILVELAHALIEPVQKALRKEPVLSWKFSGESIARLREAEGYLKQAIANQAQYEDRRFLDFAYLLRADVRRMLGDHAGAIADADCVLQQNPSDDSALSIKGLAELRQDKPQEAIATFGRIRDEQAKDRILLSFAAALNATKHPAEAVKLLLPSWKPVASDFGQISLADHLLWAYDLMSDTAAAESIVQAIHSTWPTDANALAVIAGHHRRAGDQAKAMGLLAEALSCAGGTTRDTIAIELADMHYGRDEFAQAADLYSNVADLKTNNPLSRKYLVSLYHSGALKTALTLAQNLRGGMDPLPVISEIEANILVQLGDVKGAQEIMEQIAESHPGIQKYKVSAAELALRRGLHDRARALLTEVRFAEIKNNAELLLRVGELRAILGMGDVLAYIYHARRVGFASAEIHAKYAMLVVAREHIDNVPLDFDSVATGCGVIVKVGQETRSYTILDEDDLHIERGEISPAQAHSMDLLGRKKGDVFSFRKDAFGKPVECTVVEIQSKYVRAFQETLEKFSTLFPTDSTLQPVSAPYEELRDSMFRELDRDQERLKKIGDLYQNKKVTFEAVARVLRQPPLEFRSMLTGGNYFPLLTFSGTRADGLRELEAAKESPKILLDLLALLTFVDLNLLTHLKGRYKLFTTQPVVDALTEAHAKVVLSKPYITIGKIGQNYVRQEIGPDQLAGHKEWLQKILSFLSEHAVVLPVKSLLEPVPPTPELREFLGPISTASILAAREHELPLYSEDQMLRELAYNEWKVRGVSAQPLLVEIRNKGLISKLQYTEAIAKLTLLNYRFIEIDGDAVLWVLETVGYRISRDVVQTLRVFEGPGCTLESAVDVLTDVTRRLWLDSSLYHSKIDLTDAILDALGTKRPTDEVAVAFTTMIKVKLFLVPNAVDAILNRVRLWKERKLGRSGIILPWRKTKED